MYRILIADDEGIMLESLRTIIQKRFGDRYQVETAKSGRAAIEQAEVFRPDIVFMDIQMPGINGIGALREIRQFNQSALFYIMSAYDKFDYAKEAISLGVERYLMKPITKNTVIEVVEEASAKVDEMRRRRSDQLKVQEKLETIIPVVESGFVSSMLLTGDWQEAGYYKQLLDIHEDYGYVILFEFGSKLAGGQPVSPVGLGVQAASFMPEFRAVVKSFLHCVVGGLMTGQAVVVVPKADGELRYEERVSQIEEVRHIASRLTERLSLQFRAGIGRPRRMEELQASYREALRVLRETTSRVAHANDMIVRGVYEDDFPGDVEKNLFRHLTAGDTDRMLLAANAFFDWMVRRYPESRDNIRLKVLEFVMIAERSAFAEGAVNYRFEIRENYLTEVMAIPDYDGLRSWFLRKLTEACLSIRNRRNNQQQSVIARAKAFIRENYSSDISLDDVSREVNISPYYFSKLFKEEAGENFIDYLTGLRIARARELLADPARTVKDISRMVGYADPNYFSRIFKKQTGMTPREYREAGASAPGRP